MSKNLSKKELMDELTKLIIDFPHNKWFKYDHGEFYVRYGRNIINNTHEETLQLANIDITKSHQRKGRFNRFIKILKFIANQHNIKYIIIENVNNISFLDYFKNNENWHQLEIIENTGGISFYANTR